MQRFSPFCCWMLSLLLLLGSCQAADDGEPPTPIAAAPTAVSIVPTPTLATAATETMPVGETAVAPTTTNPAPTATSSPVPATPTIPAQPSPVPITFAPGATSGTVTGTVAPAETDAYTFRALEGQWATLEITSPEGHANFGFSGLSDGIPYKRTAVAGTTWSGQLSMTQDYRLVVVTVDQTTAYTLTLTITNELPPLPGTLPEVIAWLGQAAAGGTPLSQLETVLLDAGWIESPEASRFVDLDGDGTGEWLLALRDPGNPGLFGPVGDFLVLSQEGIHYIFLDSVANEGYTAPTLVETPDMTGDGLPEAVVGSEFCGAHTCSQVYSVVSAQQGLIGPIQMTEAAPDWTWISMSSSDISFADRTGDGLPDLLLYGGFIGSAGAGPYQRGRTEIWAWDAAAGQVTLAETVLDPSSYRFHLLYEANDAFAAADYATARPQYERVVNDETLEDGPGLLSPESSYAYTRQFAAFRLMLLHQINGSEAERDAWVAWLQNEYPDAAITQALTPFMETYAGTGDVSAACTAVSTFLLTQPDPTGPLADMGYALPSLTAESVCPN